MATGGKNSARALETRERERKAFEMRRDGKSYQAIGDALGVTKPAAYQMVARVLRALNKQTAEDAQEVRRLELERLDRILAGPVLGRAADGGDEKAIAAVVRLMERRAALLGLDAPKRLDLSGEVAVKVYVTDGEGDWSPDAA